MVRPQGVRRRPTSDLSDDEATIRRRLQKNGDRHLDRLRADLDALYPEKPIEEWDFEELQAGFPRNKRGELVSTRYGNERPRWVTPLVLEEAQRRLKTMTRRQMGMYAGEAIKVMAQLMTKSKVDMVRFNAAKYILDQLIGMPTQRVEADVEVNVNNFLAQFMRNPDGATFPAIDNVEEAEIVEDEDDYENE